MQDASSIALFQSVPAWVEQVLDDAPLGTYDIPPLRKDGQSYPESLRGTITEVMTHNTSHT
jgi:hypothetical protein